MMTIISGVGLLLLTLAVFSIFSLKFPKGSQAMSGMANAAVASSPCTICGARMILKKKSGRA